MGVWWLYIVIVLCSYSGTLISFLAFPGVLPPIDSVEQLHKAVMAGKLSVGTVESGFLVNALTVSKEETIQDLVKEMMKDPANLVSSPLSGIKRVAEDAFAFIIPQLTAEVKALQIAADKIHVAKGVFFFNTYGIALHKGCPYKPAFDHAIRMIVESGLVDYWLEDYIVKLRKTAYANLDHGDEEEALNIVGVQGPFYILSIGLIVSIITFFVELLWYRRGKIRRMMGSHHHLPHAHNHLTSALSSHLGHEHLPKVNALRVYNSPINSLQSRSPYHRN